MALFLPKLVLMTLNGQTELMYVKSQMRSNQENINHLTSMHALAITRIRYCNTIFVPKLYFK